MCGCIFFFKQKTAYEMRISDWSSDVCSSDLDLGWLCLRSWRFGCDALPVGGFGERAAFYEHYQTASGIPVDIAAVHFWEVLGTLKWGVICQWSSHRRLRGESQAPEPAVLGRRTSEGDRKSVV